MSLKRQFGRGLASIAALALAALASASAAHAATLVAPFDLPKPHTAGKQTGCEMPPPPIVNFTASSIYRADDPTHSTIDPAAQARYLAAVTPLRKFSQGVSRDATRYIRSNGGNLGAAACAGTWLAAWAKGNALSEIGSEQAALSMTRVLSALAFAYIEVKPAVRLSDADKRAVEAWLGHLADEAERAYAGDNNTSKGNHRYWGGIAVGAVAIAANDPSKFAWAMDSYRIGVCQVNQEGALPIELSRGPRARDYHLHAIAPLVMLAEMGARNGLATYDECDGAIHRLVKYILTSINDPSQIEREARAKQLPLEESNSRLAWVAVYKSRYPLPVEVKLPSSLGSTGLGGDLNWLYDE